MDTIGVTPPGDTPIHTAYPIGSIPKGCK